MPQPGYELSDLQSRPIEGQFYNYELVKVTEFQIDKRVRTVTKTVLKKFSSGKDTTRLNSWVNSYDIKKI